MANIPISEKTKKFIVQIPGFFVKANIDYPNYHPHTIWWLSYISKILDGYKLEELQSNPPWPVPNDKILVNQILKELIEAKWLLVDWESGKISVTLEIKKMYQKGGEAALAKHFLAYKTISGEWWIDAITGIPMNRQRALKYDVDFSRSSKGPVKKIAPIMNHEELLESLNFDILSLIQLLGISEVNDHQKRQRAFISSPFKITGTKDIEFEVYTGIKGENQRIIPYELASLEPMLWDFAPEIFGEKKRKKTRILRWKHSIIEKFALTLEKFPNLFSLLTNQQYFQYLIENMNQELLKKEEWQKHYQEGTEIIPIAGYASQFFEVLAEICSGTANIYGNKGIISPELVIIVSSFLNRNNLSSDDGLIDSLRDSSVHTRFLIIYGHASDDTPEKQQRDINEYIQEIFKLEPSLEGRIFIVSSVKRSHEKIIITSNGDWMIGSWNTTSSNPFSKQFETAIIGRDFQFVNRILEVITENIEKGVSFQFITKFKEKIPESTENTHVKDSSFKELYNNLEKSVELFKNFLISDSSTFENIQIYYEKLINSIRYYLHPFLRRSTIKLVNEHESRDILITQIKSSTKEILIASDRISRNALDKTILQDIKGIRSEKRKDFKILWGREWENEKNIRKEAKSQIQEAKRAIRDGYEFLKDQLKTSLNPMENHAKFALFDGCRGLITSENLLSYAGERGQYESRELGIFIESIPVIRYIQGWTVFHRLDQFYSDNIYSKKDYRPYEWIVFGSDVYYALEEFQHEIEFNCSELPYIETAIIQELSNNERSNTDDFDIHLNKTRLNYFNKYQNFLHKKLIDHIWREGRRYYLLNPSIDKNWYPFTKTLPETLFTKMLNLRLIEEQQQATSNQSKIVSGIAVLSSEESHTIDPIIDKIMNNMVLIKKGSFLMGDSRVYEENPVHVVNITKDYYMSKFMITQKIWKDVMGSLPNIPPQQKSPEFPIIWVNYYDAKEFIKKLNSLPGGSGFSLPTDAQWEYACRAGSKSAYCFGDNPGSGKEAGLLEEYAWTKRNSNHKIHDVGLLKPNKWGLHDMHGLMYELTSDDIRKYKSETVEDPIGPLNSSMGIARGGAWGKFPIPGGMKRFYNHPFRCSFRSPNPKDEKSHRLSFRIIRNVLK